MGLTKQYLRYSHAGQCNSIGSANGAIIAVDNHTCGVTSCENVNFYNLRTAEKVASLSESTKAATCVAMNPDKRFLAVGYADGAIRLFDRGNEDQSECVVFAGHKKGVNCLTFSHDGLTLASGGKDCSIILWDIVSESGMFRLNGHKESITKLQFTKDDQHLISSSKDTFLKFWNLSTHSCFYTLTENRSEVYSFVMLKEDSLLITASSEMELYVFDLQWLKGDSVEKSEETPDSKKARGDEGKKMVEEGLMGEMENRIVRVSLRGKVLRQCKGRALQLAATSDGQFVACLGSDRLIDIYRVYSDEEAQKRLTKKLRKAKRKANESGMEDFIGEDVQRDVTIVVARVGDWRPAKKPKWLDFNGVVEEGSNENEIVYKAFTLFVNNSVHLVSFTCNTQSNEITTNELANLDQMGHREDVRSIAVASHNALVATGGGDSVILWNGDTLRPVNTLQEEGMEDVTSVVFAPGDRHILAGTKDGKLFLFDANSCECLESRVGHEGSIWSIVSTPDGKGFVTASADKKVKFWIYELVTEGTMKRLSVKQTRELELPDEALCCSMSPDGKFLAVGMLDTTTAVYFVDSLKFFLSLYGHSLPVTSCSISPDSKLIVTGSADKSIKVWGLDFGDCHKSFHAHDDVVSAVLFSRNMEDTLVWSSGRDGKVKQWDPIKFEKVQTLDRHCAEVRCLAQTSNGATLFSASHDKSVRAWDLTEEIIVLQEEEEMERETEYEARLAEEDDVVPGEREEGEATLATTKSQQSIVSTENIIDAVDIVRKELVAQAEDPEYTPHPMYLAYRSKSLDHFILDVIAKVRPSNLERSLLLVPLSYVPDIIQSLCTCVTKHYKVEFASRVAVFLIRIHHSHVINNHELVPLVDKLRKQLPEGISRTREMTGFNLAALRLLAVELEEAQEVKMFADLSQVSSKKKKGKKAAIKTLV